MLLSVWRSDRPFNYSDALAAELARDLVRLEQKYDLVVLQGQVTRDRPLFAPGEVLRQC